MFDALYIGATGMQAQQQHVDAIANNLANMNTTAYKKARVGFADLMVAPTAGRMDATTGTPELSRLAALGVGITGISKVFEAGDLKKTDSPMDVGIQGDGFLEVVLADGARGYTRGGTLKVNKDGLLATSTGLPLKPGIAIPEGAQDVRITTDGRVQVRMPNQTQPQEVGQLEMARFSNPGLLTVVGDNLYRATESLGDPIAARAGDEGMGTLVQGFVESSNVKMVDEMVGLMMAQRAYEATVKVVQASDEMLGLVNNLRK